MSFNHQGYYTCICGQEFTNSQKFNAHKQACTTHLVNKYGSLDAYYAIKNRNSTQSAETQRRKFAEKRQLELTKWIAEQHKCEKCGKVMTEKFGSGRFCSRYCANSRVHSEETKQKISVKLTSSIEPKFCKVCGKPLNSRNTSGFCSPCYLRQPHTEESKRKQSETMKSKCYPRWNIHRDEPSYAEKFFMSVLQNNSIDYKREYSVPNNKKHFYYLDFYIEKNDKKIDLEIDGKQHKERLEHDSIRDAYLIDKGYIVYRIVWNNINSDSGKLNMQNKIQEFIDFYNSL